MRIRGFASILLLLFGMAQAAVLVDSVNMPAWRTHEGVVSPLIPGTIIAQSDLITTGQGGRVLLRLPEGSIVKLGENANLRADILGEGNGQTEPYAAVINVLKGAFRFTTSLLGKSRHRAIDLHVASVTAGIRGTDVWGKSDDTKDLVCLLEGKISVGHDGEANAGTMLDTPLAYYAAEKGKTASPVGSVPMEKVIKEWAPQTEPQMGLASANGHTVAMVATSGNQADALAIYDRLRAAGYGARIRPRDTEHFDVIIDHLRSAQDARIVRDRARTALNTAQ